MKSVIAFLSAVTFVSSAYVRHAGAQTPPVLGLQLYAGLSITGAIGTVYSIEYVADPTHIGSSDIWRCLEFLQLPASPYRWVDQAVPARATRFYRAVAFRAPPNLVFIPPGTFRLGSSTNELDRGDKEGPQMAVTISHGFWMGQYPVVQGEYQEVIGTNPSRFTGDTNRPVEQVTWLEAVEYCGKITARQRAAGLIPADCVYRLPTEAEWEYACRAWTSTRFSHGDDPGYTDLTSYAWDWANSYGTTQPVGQLLPNPWGLYDMHGNVSQWCQDWYGEYPGGMTLDPQGPAIGANRVVRGGAWDYLPQCCRSAARLSSAPEAASYDVGFRVVLAPAR
jgi:formylglycine-generating enzyme required for sulfatase activity